MCTSTQFAVAGVFVQCYVGVFILLEVLWVPGASGMAVQCLIAVLLQGLPGILDLLFACALVQDPGIHLSKSTARQPLTVG